MPSRILVVDDESPILLAMSTYFRMHGYEVDCAREREEAEALLTARRYACVIADLRLTAAHGADGLELVGFVRERCPWTRIVVMTAYAFLHKPKPLPQVAQIVYGLLGDES